MSASLDTLGVVAVRLLEHVERRHDEHRIKPACEITRDCLAPWTLRYSNPAISRLVGTFHRPTPHL